VLTARPGSDRSAARPVSAGLRVLLVAFTALTVLGFLALDVLAPDTEHLFAWTIQPPITAAFLGSGYAAGTLLVALTLRTRAWVNARVAVLTVFVFTVLTLGATLLHLDRFHFGADGLIARGAAWFWLTVYVVVPAAMAVLLVVQRRALGADPPARLPMPGWLVVALAIQGTLMLAVGVALYVAPATASSLWPWALTPLTARAVASWLVAFGLAAALAIMEQDLGRLELPAAAYTVLGSLQLEALVRFAGQVRWASPAAAAYVAVLVTVVATGAYGWWAGFGHHRGRVSPAARRIARQPVPEDDRAPDAAGLREAS
jgi:hypothetical protein